MRDRVKILKLCTLAAATLFDDVVAENNKAIPTSIYVQLSPSNCTYLFGFPIVTLFQDGASIANQAYIKSPFTGFSYPLFANSNCDYVNGTINRVKFR